MEIQPFDLTFIVGGNFEGFESRQGESVELARTDLVFEVKSEFEQMLSKLNESYVGFNFQIADFYVRSSKTPERSGDSRLEKQNPIEG